MSSYISSFRALLAALAIITVTEVGYSAVDTSSPVERSSYLNLNFNSIELFQKAIIYEKLDNAVAAAPNIIQVGDSSGFHSIVPRIVEQYLPGLTYENLSCCASTGFDGYYSIVEFMLRNTTSIKAVVLYFSWGAPPADIATMQSELVGGDDRVRNAFGWPAPFISPATLSARAKVLRPIYTLGDTFEQPGLLPFDTVWPDLIQSLRANSGWWAEHDAHRTAEKQMQMSTMLCGPGGLDWSDTSVNYARDIFAFRQSHTKTELRRLADLTARHHAKLIVLFQPLPCPSIAGDYISARQSDFAALVADYSNVVVPDRALIEPWPAQWFTSFGHLRTGHEGAVSRRAGRAIARALDVAFVEPPERPAPNVPVLEWSNSDFTASSWQHEGLLLAPQSTGRGVVATETSDGGWHRVTAVLPDLKAKTYVLSVAFRASGQRQIRLEMMDLKSPGAYGVVRCNPWDGESWRSGAMLDAGIEELPDHAFRCWGKLRLTRAGAAIGISLMRTIHEPGPYQGDGRNGVVLQSVDISAVDAAEE
jgi:hypothetical protein